MQLQTKLFGSRLWPGGVPGSVIEVPIDGLLKPGLIHADGLLLTGSDGNMVSMIRFLKLKIFISHTISKFKHLFQIELFVL